MVDVMISQGGVLFAALGAAFAILFPGIGSSTGCGLVGKTATGLLVDEPEKFGGSLLLGLVPSSQGLYGFLIGFLIIARVDVNMSFIEGLYCLICALPITFVGYRSAFYQAEIAQSGINVLSKNPKENIKTVILSALVEMYAIFGLVGSLILLNKAIF